MSGEHPDARRETVTIDRRPTRMSGAIAIAAMTIGMAVVVPFFLLAIPFGLAAIGFIAGGVLVTGSRGWVSLGVTSGFIALLLVGLITGVDPLFLGVGAVGVFIAWDVGQHAITIGEQFGRDGRTQRGELMHAGASCLVGAIGLGVTYGVYLAGTGGQPTLAVFLLVVGLIGLIWALRD